VCFLSASVASLLKNLKSPPFCSSRPLQMVEVTACFGLCFSGLAGGAERMRFRFLPLGQDRVRGATSKSSSGCCYSSMTGLVGLCGYLDMVQPYSAETAAGRTTGMMYRAGDRSRRTMAVRKRSVETVNFESHLHLPP
jgi:hypothetical protein